MAVQLTHRIKVNGGAVGRGHSGSRIGRLGDDPINDYFNIVLILVFILVLSSIIKALVSIFPGFVGLLPMAALLVEIRLGTHYHGLGGGFCYGVRFVTI